MYESTCTICIAEKRRRLALRASVVPVALNPYEKIDEGKENSRAVSRHRTLVVLERRESRQDVEVVEVEPEDEVPEIADTEDTRGPHEEIEPEPEPEKGIKLKSKGFKISDKKLNKFLPLPVTTETILGEKLPPLLTEEEKLEKKRLGEMPNGMVINIPLNRIRPMPDQPRVYFDAVKIARLTRSIKKHGQRKPAEVKWLPDDPRYYCELIDGERRWMAAEKAGRSTLRCLITYVADKKQQFVYSVISNFGREGHTPLEIANSINRLFKDGWSYVDIADAFGQSLSWVYQHVKVALLASEVQAMMDPSSSKKDHNLKLLTALQLIYFPSELQIALAREVIKENMPVIVARQYIRKRAKEEGFPPTDPNRSPRKDYANLQSSLHIMKDRMRLLLHIDPHELSTIFRYRDPIDITNALKDSEVLSGQIEDFKKNLQRI